MDLRRIDAPRELAGRRFVGDKRSQVVYDLETASDDAAVVERLVRAVADIVATQSYATFGPDELREARNRGYRLSRLCGSSQPR
ncbi:hypothetical protein [Candidatus Poriferisodalis sp.]|uniref:hypothetical protein n=1 Tax=Candidatus Poriferisodalis sp. TaxID=3101277 RepID=UPI003B02C8CE